MVPTWAIQPSPGENSRHLGTEEKKGGRLELGKTGWQGQSESHRGDAIQRTETWNKGGAELSSATWEG